MCPDRSGWSVSCLGILESIGHDLCKRLISSTQLGCDLNVDDNPVLMSFLKPRLSSHIITENVLCESASMRVAVAILSGCDQGDLARYPETDVLIGYVQLCLSEIEDDAIAHVQFARAASGLPDCYGLQRGVALVMVCSCSNERGRLKPHEEKPEHVQRPVRCAFGGSPWAPKSRGLVVMYLSRICLHICIYCP